MRIIEIIMEGYPDTKKFYIDSGANIDDVNNTVDTYKQLSMRLTGDLKNIDKVRRMYPEFNMFKQFVDNLANTPTKTQIKRRTATGNSITLKSPPGWEVIVPLDKSASCNKGDRAWCVAHPEWYYFEKYFYQTQHTMIFLTNTTTNQRWAIALHNDPQKTEYVTQDNDRISKQQFIEQTGLNPDQFEHQIVTQHSKEIQTVRKTYQDAVKELTSLLKAMQGVRNAEIEKLLFFTKHGPLSYQYLSKLKQLDLTNIPKEIIRSAILHKPELIEREEFNSPTTNDKLDKLIDQYRVHAIKQNVHLLRSIDHPSEAVVDAALETSGDSLKYISPPYEKVIQYPRSAASYAVSIGKRIPEAESKIATDRASINTYIKGLPVRIQKVEHSIMHEHPQLIYYYAKNNVKKRWKEAEKFFTQLTDAQALEVVIEYAQHFQIPANDKTWETVEKYLINYPTVAAKYASTILKQPWDSARSFGKRIHAAITDFIEHDADEVTSDYLKDIYYGKVRPRKRYDDIKSNDDDPLYDWNKE